MEDISQALNYVQDKYGENYSGLYSSFWKYSCTPINLKSFAIIYYELILNYLENTFKGIVHMFKSIITGKAFKLGDDIDTDQIYPGRYLYLTSPEEMAVHVMEDAVPNFYKKIEGEDWIIVAGKNFGCGSSREHAPRAILYAGIKAVVAESFGRIFYRNAINVGLPVLKYPEIIKEVHQNDSIKINLKDGLITLYNPERKISIEKYPPQLLSILKSGGLIPYLKKFGKYSHLKNI